MLGTIKGIRIYKQIHLFISVMKNHDGTGFGVVVAPEYKSEHFCTRDVFITFWKYQITLWLEDASA